PRNGTEAVIWSSPGNTHSTLSIRTLSCLRVLTEWSREARFRKRKVCVDRFKTRKDRIPSRHPRYQNGTVVQNVDIAGFLTECQLLYCQVIATTRRFCVNYPTRLESELGKICRKSLVCLDGGCGIPTGFGCALSRYTWSWGGV